MALYDMYELVVFTGLALSALVGVDQIFVRKAASKDSVVSTVTNPEFLRFQNTYCIVYFLAVFADWLQGPYVYKLYSYYGFGEFEIAVLYIIGFAVSATLGTFTGPLADKFGRKRMCLIFCVLYGLTCLTKVSSSGIVLGLGRVLGGISTSILFSAFESWYVYEHKERYQFDSSWLSLTFGRTTYWNGILAIFAGVVANVVAEDLQFGPLAPFIVAIPVLMACAVAIQTGWHENYGQSTFSFRTSCMEGLYKILDSRLIFLPVFVAECRGMEKENIKSTGVFQKPNADNIVSTFALPEIENDVYRCRYALSAFSHVGLVLVYFMRVNVSVAVVIMSSAPHLHTTSEPMPGAMWAAAVGGKMAFGLSVLTTALISLVTPLLARAAVEYFIASRVVMGLVQGLNPEHSWLSSFRDTSGNHDVWEDGLRCSFFPEFSESFGPWFGMFSSAVLLFFVPIADSRPPLAIGLFTGSVGMLAATLAGVCVNHIDLAPNFAGFLMAFTNTLGTIPGIAIPAVTQRLVGLGPNPFGWRVVIWGTSFILVAGNIIFLFLGSAEEQTWNNTGDTVQAIHLQQYSSLQMLPSTSTNKASKQ
ncbi:unnamed protein product [Cyprideis torosa]|uniref:Molybdate-anion transporter n=1 Tax=Cyprideis torosa TaxID=163714 RepID=A0A7R8ZP09_9CRUS|nr:unnamed protein product [Cyprideis torosa]CAG0899302.1 unnamed protein product [Cyprideis torosa]